MIRSTEFSSSILFDNLSIDKTNNWSTKNIQNVYIFKLKADFPFDYFYGYNK